MQYYEEMVRVVKGIMGNGPLWENVKAHWKTYLNGDDGIEEQGTAGVERMNNHDIDLPGDDDDE